MKRSILAFVAALALASTSVSRDALAQSAPRDTRDVGRLLREGAAAYDAHDDANALALFQQAYRISEEPTILVNIGRVFTRLGRVDDAIATYERYVSRVPASPERAAIEGLIREQRAQRDAASNARAAAERDAMERRAREERDRREREERERRERERQSRGIGAGPWVLMGVGGALALGSLVPFFAVRAPAVNTLDQRCERPDSMGIRWCLDAEGSLPSVRDQATTGTIAFGALLATGLATATAGGIWAAIAGTRTEQRVSVTVDPRGAFVVAGTFGGPR